MEITTFLSLTNHAFKVTFNSQPCKATFSATDEFITWILRTEFSDSWGKSWRKFDLLPLQVNVTTVTKSVRVSGRAIRI